MCTYVCTLLLVCVNFVCISLTEITVISYEMYCNLFLVLRISHGILTQFNAYSYTDTEKISWLYNKSYEWNYSC